MCEVCNWHGDDDVCPRCGTVLRVGSAKCQMCGGDFVGPVAHCSDCGNPLQAADDAPDEALQGLTRLPGIDDSMARSLFGHGINDPADLLRIGLPDHAVRTGLHRTLARKATMQELHPLSLRTEVPCGVCETPKASADAVCSACGARGERGPTVADIQYQLAQVVGEVNDLEADPDFLGMPSDLRAEILHAVREDTTQAAMRIASPTIASQFVEWRSRGIDTVPLERVFIEEGEEAFRGKFALILRRQFAKRRKAGRFWCTVCNQELASDDGECDNCGAKFT